MRYTRKNLEVGDKRIITSFCIIPVCIDGFCVFAERVEIEQEYCVFRGHDWSEEYHYWKNLKFV